MVKKIWMNQRYILSFLLILALFFSSLLSYTSTKRLQGNGRIINYAGVVRGGTQRLIKKELQGKHDDALQIKLDTILNELQTGKGELDLYSVFDDAFQTNLTKMQQQWALIKEEITQLRNGKDPSTLFALSESYFDLCDETVSIMEVYSEDQVSSTLRYMIGMNTMFVGLAILFMLYTARARKRHASLALMEVENRKKSAYLSQMMDDFRAPIDDISELVYIADIENHDLLYINEAGRKTYHIDDINHLKCYRALQGRDSPCPFCTNKKIKGGEVYTWEFTNALTNRHYILKDRLVEWHGKTARLEIAFDTTDSENEKVKLQNLLEAEKMLMDSVRVLYEESDINHGIQDVLQKLGTYLDADRTYIFDINNPYFYNTFEWCKAEIPSQMEHLQHIPISHIDRWMDIFKQNKCVIIEHLEDFKDTSPNEYETLSAQGIKTLVAAPLEYDGEIAGFVGVDNPPIEKLEHIASYLQTLRYFLMLASRRHESEAMLSNLSYHDALTSFYNRNRFIQDIKEYTKFNVSIGVVFLDVNGLKDINDRFGHAKGDQVLIKCATMIKEAFQHYDYYRIGGDEYVVLCKDISEQHLFEYVRQLRNSLKEDPLCQAAIGSYWSACSKDIDQAITYADARMYEDKKQFYRENTSSKRYRHHSDEILSLINEDVLKQEIKHHKFKVYLQPKISSVDDHIVGAEALIRYQSKSGTIIAPNDFLTLLEETQLISYIDLFVFESVCQLIKKWKKSGVESFPVSVNFSRCSLAEPNIVETLIALCSTYEVPCSLIEIEITENNKSGTNLDLQSLVDELHHAGFKISIDDFGTEFANISILTSIDFDILKIDKSLIDDIETNEKERMIIKIVSGYCSDINLQIVAEGVEKQSQLDILKECNVFVIQGYFYSKPLPIEHFEKVYIDPQIS